MDNAGNGCRFAVPVLMRIERLALDGALLPHEKQVAVVSASNECHPN
jgi:hypothetical protein